MLNCTFFLNLDKKKVVYSILLLKNQSHLERIFANSLATTNHQLDGTLCLDGQ